MKVSGWPIVCLLSSILSLFVFSYAEAEECITPQNVKVPVGNDDTIYVKRGAMHFRRICQTDGSFFHIQKNLKGTIKYTFPWAEGEKVSCRYEAGNLDIQNTPVQLKIDGENYLVGCATSALGTKYNVVAIYFDP